MVHVIGCGKRRGETYPSVLTADTRDRWVESEDELQIHVLGPALQYPVANVQSAKKPANRLSQLRPPRFPCSPILRKVISFKDSIRACPGGLVKMKRMLQCPGQFNRTNAGNLEGKNKKDVESGTGRITEKVTTD